ncbi:MAG: TonB-dependent receptor, partial [Longimicrobiales bacterium]|nr:TonB-dependent receptor [Longimicrobiales bacterium]
MRILRLVRSSWVPCAVLSAGIAWALPAAAQTGTITGTVIESSTQQPLSGAQVSVVGTGLGTLTTAQGRFLIRQVPVGDQRVRVELIGYGTTTRTVTVGAGETVTINFELAQSAIALDEIVVTGQGRARQRRELSTTVDVIDARDLELAPVQSVEELIRGRVAGATISATSAQPGTGSTINFRGVSSVFGSQTPVIYVDGVKVDNSDEIGLYTGGEYSSALSELLVSDIERVEITKGGAASTLYGADAASGVIQIFTKKGTQGPARFTARIEQGLDTPELKYMFDTGLIYPDLVEQGAPGDFLKENFFRVGHFQNYYTSVSGGSADVTFDVSARIQDSEGVQPKNGSQVWNLRGGMQAAVTDRLRLSFSGTYTRQDYSRLFNGDAIADPLTSFEVGDVFFFTGVDRSPDNFGEALDIFISPEIDEDVNRFLFSTGLDYQISQLLTSRVTAGVDFRQSQQRIFEPIGFTPGEVTGELNRFDREFSSVSLDAAMTLSYPETEILENSLTVGAQGFREDLSTIVATGNTFALPGAPDFDEAADITASEFNQELFNGGIYIEDQVGLWDQLFLNAGVRFDFNSTFGEDVEFETYPKLGASYLLSEADPLQDIDFVTNLKLRAAWGQTGKFPEPFLRDRTFEATPFRGASAPTFDNP